MLFGVALVPGILATAADRLVPAAARPMLEQIIGFVCFGVYFVWMWTHGGQTLPMQTWRIRLITAEGETPSVPQALLRYLAAWLWVLPAIGVAHVLGWQRWHALGAAATWAALYGLAAHWLPQRQSLHDWVCRTRLVALPK